LPDVLNTYRLILSLLDRREKRRLGLLLVLIMVTGLLETAGVAAILPLLSVLSDPGLVETNRILARLYATLGFTSIVSFQFFLGFATFVTVVAGLAFRALTTYGIIRFTRTRSYLLSRRMLQNYLHQPYAWFLSKHSSQLSTVVLTEVENMISRVMMPAMKLLPALVTALMIAGLVLLMEPVVAFGVVVVIGGSFWMIYMALRRALRRFGVMRKDANSARFRVVQEATGGIKELKLMGLEPGFLQRFEVEARRMARAESMVSLTAQMPRIVIEGLAFGTILLVILFLLIRGGGDIAATLPAIGLIALASMRLMPAMQLIYQHIASVRANDKLLESVHQELTEIRSSVFAARAEAEKLPPLPLREKLELREVSYAYPTADRQALDRLSMTIRANSRVGIVGSTGAGKTTVVDIILGLLRPQSGALVVDGREITDDLLRPWQKSVGYVPQHIFLSDDTVAANVAFGIPAKAIDMQAVERAARIAALHDFVLEKLPQGYATPVGERGMRLSGGQRQRIGIARALYHDPDILVLDEATSALDNLTEQAVMEAVSNLAGAKTVVMIAHRLSTVRDCETIFLLEHGRLAAQGTYDELVQTNVQFRRMVGGMT
jgi:ATP-binding cassette, subfamily B, bacterial PglK